VASLAEDASALLEALEVPRAHVLCWSLGSAAVQELALAHPDQVASALLYATWGRCDGFQRSVLSALRLPYVHRDMESALATSGLAFSPQLLDHPDFAQMLEPMLPAFPQDEEQMQVTVEQLDADLAHNSLDRLGAISAPTLVIVGAGPADPAMAGEEGGRRDPGRAVRVRDGTGVEPRPTHRAPRGPREDRHRVHRRARDRSLIALDR